MRAGRYQDEAVVLKRVNFGEADLIVHLFSRDHGNFSGLAKHGRKSLKRFGNVLSPGVLSRMDFTIKPNRDLAQLESGELIRVFERISQNASSLAHASLALELVDVFCPSSEPSPDIFDLLLWSLNHLDDGAPPRETLFKFILHLVKSAGFGPSLSECVVCGRPPEDFAGRLHVEKGGLACRSCAPGGQAVRLGVVKVMRLVQQFERAKLDRVRVDEACLLDAWPFLIAYVRHVIGRDFNSLKFMQQLSGLETAAPKTTGNGCSGA